MRSSLAYAIAAASLATSAALQPSKTSTMQSVARRPFAAGAIATFLALPANALVKGSAPPPKAAKYKRTCVTIDECEETGRQRAAAEYDSQNQPFQTTKDGVRWRPKPQSSNLRNK